MKICFLAPANSVHSHKWIAYFLDLGWDVTWLSIEPPLRAPDARASFVQLPTGTRPQELLAAGLRCRRIVRNLSPDVLHVHSVGTYGLLSCLTAYRPTIVTPWGSDVVFGLRSPIKRFWIRRALRRADLVTCDADHIARLVQREGVPSERIRIINFGVDTERYGPPRNQRAPAPGEEIVVSLRSLEPVYDIASLIAAVPLVLQTHPGVRFKLAGRGSEEDALRRQAAGLGVAHAIDFLGFFPASDLPALLQTADIYVSTSLSDAGLASSTAEAMACELPVIITRSADNAEWIEDGSNGFLVSPSAPHEIAARIVDLIGSADLRRRLGAAARKTIIARNSYTVEMDKMRHLYEDVARHEARRTG